MRNAAVGLDGLAADARCQFARAVVAAAGDTLDHPVVVEAVRELCERALGFLVAPGPAVGGVGIAVKFDGAAVFVERG
ncbi:hypothetical protein D3C81_805820 [compost metagenome]